MEEAVATAAPVTLPLAPPLDDEELVKPDLRYLGRSLREWKAEREGGSDLGVMACLVYSSCLQTGFGLAPNQRAASNVLAAAAKLSLARGPSAASSEQDPSGGRYDIVEALCLFGGYAGRQENPKKACSMLRKIIANPPGKKGNIGGDVQQESGGGGGGDAVSLATGRKSRASKTSGNTGGRRRSRAGGNAGAGASGTMRRRSTASGAAAAAAAAIHATEQETEFSTFVKAHAQLALGAASIFGQDGYGECDLKGGLALLKASASCPGGGHPLSQLLYGCGMMFVGEPMAAAGTLYMWSHLTADTRTVHERPQEGKLSVDANEKVEASLRIKAHRRSQYGKTFKTHPF